MAKPGTAILAIFSFVFVVAIGSSALPADKLRAVIPRACSRRPKSSPILRRKVLTILDDLAKKLPAARAANPRDFMDPRFIQELDKSGYIDALYR
jgi:hypothetical protein